MAAVLLVQVYFLREDLFELFGPYGIFQESVTRYLVDPAVPRLPWFTPTLASWGINENTALMATAVIYTVSLVCLCLGVATRLAAVVAWGLHWILMNTGLCSNYGADVYAHVFLFYLIWMPSGDVWSLDSLIRKEKKPPSDIARMSIRVIQLQLCITYFVSAWEKAAGPQWWSGEVIWRALTLPVYIQWDMTWMAHYPWFAKLAAWGTLVAEFGYALFIWPRQTRWLWISLMVSLHIGIIVFLGLGLFGAIMTCFTLAAFGISAEPQPFRRSSSVASPLLAKTPLGV